MLKEKSIDSVEIENRALEVNYSEMRAVLANS